VEIVERTTPIVSLTETAAGKIRELQAEEPQGEASVLRIAIQGGGCSGFEYALGFDRGAQEGDLEVEAYGVTVVVDPFSAPHLKGATIDFLSTLQESGFKIDNPNAGSSCGCGHSFQPAEGEEQDAAAGSQGGCGSGCAH
jgi:iron-sulfur cluster assembly accessory protein